MNILIACEYSGRVRDTFIAKGHQTISCDLLPSETEGPHYMGSVRALLDNDDWHMIIAFPPCTHLANSGARWFKEKRADGRQQQGIDLFMQFANHPCERICIENPVGIMSTKWRKPDQIIQSWLLEPTKIVGKGEFVIHGGKKLPKWYSNRSRPRDKTFRGIAQAMANQWGN